MSEFPVAGGFHPDDEPATEAEANLGILEFLADFQSTPHTLDDGVSVLRRPDAISLDYLTCFTLGPINLADFSQGPVDRPWKVRAVGNVIYSARQNNARTGFDPEVELFRFAGVGPIEIDAAFDQAARILVCMERATGPGGQSELWIYYFDPFLGDFTLTKFGVGRTPRAALDEAVDSNIADVLVFYMNNSVGMCYRMQRERYAVEHIVTGTIPTAVDSSGLHMQGPIAWSYPGPRIADTFYGYSVAIGSAGGVNLQLDSLIDTTPGIFRPLPGTHFRAMYIGEGPPGAGNGGLIEIRFDKPVNGIEIELKDATFAGASCMAMDKDFRELGRVNFGATVGGAAQLGQLFFEGIRYLELLTAPFDFITWDNLRFTTDPLPLPVGPDVWPPAPNIYIEDVYKSTSNRLDVLYSVHDPEAGTYQLKVKSSVLYPFKMTMEEWKFNGRPVSGLIPDVLLFVMEPGHLNPAGGAPTGFIDVENWKFGSLPQPGTLVSIIIFHTLFDHDDWKFGAIPQSGTVPQVLFFHTLFDHDDWKFNAVPLSGTVPVIVIVHVLFDHDDWKFNAIPQSGSLV